MFDTIRKRYLSRWTNIKWVSEVNMGVGGSVDYVAVTRDKANNITDFFCVEIQAAGTTGSPYPAVKDIKDTGRFQKDSYNYGINWANEFSKTMMQQAYKKGKIVNYWNRKIVFVLQDVGIQYIRKSCDTRELRDYECKMPIDFCSFKMVWDANRDSWILEFDAITSTDINGINSMLGGAVPDMYLSEKEFIININKKGVADKVFEQSGVTA